MREWGLVLSLHVTSQVTSSVIYSGVMRCCFECQDAGAARDPVVYYTLQLDAVSALECLSVMGGNVCTQGHFRAMPAHANQYLHSHKAKLALTKTCKEVTRMFAHSQQVAVTASLAPVPYPFPTLLSA